MSEEDLKKMVSTVAASLSEQIDGGTVQILISWNEDGLTRFYHDGCGNWYARQGMAREFITLSEAQTHAHELDGVINREE